MIKNGQNCCSQGSLTARWMDKHPLFVTQRATDGISARWKWEAFGFCLCLSDVSVAHVHGEYRRLVNSCCSRHYAWFQSGPSLEMAAVSESVRGTQNVPADRCCTTSSNWCQFSPNRTCCTRYREAQKAGCLGLVPPCPAPGCWNQFASSSFVSGTIDRKV